MLKSVAEEIGYSSSIWYSDRKMGGFMQISMEILEELSKYLPILAAYFGSLWALFGLNDYVYKKRFCRYFEILDYPQLEIKFGQLHPRYLLTVLIYYALTIIILISIYCLKTTLYINQQVVTIVGMFIITVILSVFSRIIAYKKNTLEKLDKEKDAQKVNVKYFTKTEEDMWVCCKFVFTSVILVVYALLLFKILNAYPWLVALMTLFGTVFLYGLWNNCYNDWVGAMFFIGSDIPYFIRNQYVFSEDEKLYAILLPSSNVTSSNYVACRVFVYRTVTKLTYSFLDTSDIRMFSNIDEKKIIRYIPNHIGRVLDSTRFDNNDDSVIEAMIKKVYPVVESFDGKEWKQILGKQE